MRSAGGVRADQMLPLVAMQAYDEGQVRSKFQELFVQNRASRT